MSHERLASLWTILSQYQDVTVCIRDATGHFAFNSVLSDDEPEASLKAFVIYAVELIAILDYMRTVGVSTDLQAHPEKHTLYKDQLCRALAYLTHNLRTEHVTGEPPLSRLYVAVITRAILSATCALHSISTAQQSREAEHVATAAYKTALRIPESREDLGLLRLLCSYLISHVGGGTMAHRTDEVIATRGDIWHMNHSDRSEVIEELVERATKDSTTSISRVMAIIELCQAYWESEACLVRGCMREDLASETSAPDGECERLKVALEIRAQIQEHLINANMDDATDLWARAFGPHMLFMPGLAPPCTLDTCGCAFHTQERVTIDHARKCKAKLLQKTFKSFHLMTRFDAGSPEYVDAIFERLKTRLQYALGDRYGRPKPSVNDSRDHPSPTRDTGLQRSKSADVFPAAVDHNSPSQPGLTRRYSPRPPPGRSMSCTTIDEVTASVFEHLTHQSTPALIESGQGSSGGLSRTASMTNSDVQSRDFETGQKQSDTRQTSDEGYKIVVEGPRPGIIESPWSLEKTFPEVVIRSAESDNASILSEQSIPATVLPAKGTISRGKWGNLLRSRKDNSSTFTVPKFRFFASGKHVMLWTKHGGGIIDTKVGAEQEFLHVREPDIVYAAGGTNCFVVIGRLHEGYKVSVYRLGAQDRFAAWEIPRGPGAIDLSPDDRYLAIKYTRTLHLYDLHNSGMVIQHKLPPHDNSRPGFGNHLVSFSSDSLSFMAATRFQPEKVYIYWNQCAQSATPMDVVAYSIAPFGHVDDHGLTGLTVSSPTGHNWANAFLSTFTEKGHPVTINMNPKSPTSRLLRDPKERIGTRIHGAAMSTDLTSGKSSVVLVNQNNAVFWVSDVFGRDIDSNQIGTLKRAKSMKNEVQVIMSDVDEASVFWIDKTQQRAVLQRIGRSGGIGGQVCYRLDNEPMCSG